MGCEGDVIRDKLFCNGGDDDYNGRENMVRVVRAA